MSQAVKEVAVFCPVAIGHCKGTARWLHRHARPYTALWWGTVRTASEINLPLGPLLLKSKLVTDAWLRWVPQIQVKMIFSKKSMYPNLWRQVNQNGFEGGRYSQGKWSQFDPETGSLIFCGSSPQSGFCKESQGNWHNRKWCSFLVMGHVPHV